MGRGIQKLCYHLIQSRSLHHSRLCRAADNLVNHTHDHYLKNNVTNPWRDLSERQLLRAPLFFCWRTSASPRFYSTRTTSGRKAKQERTELTAQDEDPFDSITDKIPQKPVTFVEGASYSLVILFGFAIAGFAAYGVFKELIFEPKEYKVFNKALSRIQNENQVTVRIGSPITGYGQETRNRAARQHIPHRSWADEDGVQRVEVQFYIRGPYGAGRVHSEMFKDKVDKEWKFTYLIVDITSPTTTRLMLESYVPT